VKVLPPAVLFLEAIVVALAIPVALTVGGRDAAVGAVLAALAVLLVLAAGMARTPRGVAMGSVLQVAVIASGVLLPALLLVGLIFLGVWITALYFGSQADRIEAQHKADVARMAREPAHEAGSQASEPPAAEG
jgi:hypothetical protein